jgi:hypothetical protein
MLLKMYDRRLDSYEKLLGIQGVGYKTIRALVLMPEFIYRNPLSFRDPVSFSFTHGGKDG